MGVQVRYGTIAVGAYMAHQPGSHQRAFGDQYEPKWDRGGARSPKTWRDRNRWDSLWSWGCRVGGGDLEGYSATGLSCADGYEPFSCDGEGGQFKNRIVGTCLDSGEVAVAGAIVQGFVTATDAFVGEVQSNTDGTYVLMTEQLTSTAHYLVAYKPGAPDTAGTTVNTLLPTAS